MAGKKRIKAEELKSVNGGMSNVSIKSPKLLSPILRMIFKIKKEDGTESSPDNNG